MMLSYRLSFLMALVPMGLAIPMKMVTSGKPRCTMVESPVGTDLKIHYRAPGKKPASDDCAPTVIVE